MVANKKDSKPAKKNQKNTNAQEVKLEDLASVASESQIKKYSTSDHKQQKYDENIDWKMPSKFLEETVEDDGDIDDREAFESAEEDEIFFREK